MSCQVYVNKRDRKSVGHTKLWEEMIKKWVVEFLPSKNSE